MVKYKQLLQLSLAGRVLLLADLLSFKKLVTPIPPFIYFRLKVPYANIKNFRPPSPLTYKGLPLQIFGESDCT